MRLKRKLMQIQSEMICCVISLFIVIILWKINEERYAAQMDAYEHSQKMSLKLSAAAQDKSINDLPRGARVQDVAYYRQNKMHQNFKCIHSGLEVGFQKINDDYCDCPSDGSDEPGTSACGSNGRFYCVFHQMSSKPSEVWIPSGRVNDGICDCCDGSDEWLNKDVHIRMRLSEKDQQKFNLYQAPCIDRCD